MHAEELRAGHARWFGFPQASEREERTLFVLFCQVSRSGLDCRAATRLAMTGSRRLFAVPDAGMRVDDALQPGGKNVMILEAGMMVATGQLQPDRGVG